MHPYWFTFEPLNSRTPLNSGAGVTARDDEDARRLVREAFGDLSVAKMAVLKDLDGLDQGHVRPNMGNILVRGIWFPLGYENIGKD